MSDAKERLEAIRQEVTQKVIADLKKYELEGKSPTWIKPWRTNGENGLPQNLDGRNYSGINNLVLLLTKESKGYTSDRWGTFKAIKDNGGIVKKGETATPAFFYKRHLFKEKSENGIAVRDENGKPMVNSVYLLRYYNVFNVSQTTLKTEVDLQENLGETRYSGLSELVGCSKAVIDYGYDKACYSVDADRICMPALRQFKTEEDYWATLLHEMVHWTGHESRMDRFKQFSYPTEELIAELGASFLCAEFNVDGNLQHSEYIHSWIKELEGDSKHIFKAAAQASQAHRMIKAFHSEKSGSAESAA